MATKTVGVRELKDQAPRLVQRAERGEQILITRHGRRAAMLGPVPASQTTQQGRPRLRAWERERQAFERLLPKLERRMRGQFVAVHEGKVHDSDADAAELFRRVARRLGGRTFFIGRVSAAEPVIDMPGFSVA